MYIRTYVHTCGWKGRGGEGRDSVLLRHAILPHWPGGYLGYRWGVLYTIIQCPPGETGLPDARTVPVSSVWGGGGGGGEGATSCLARVHMNNLLNFDLKYVSPNYIRTYMYVLPGDPFCQLLLQGLDMLM